MYEFGFGSLSLRVILFAQKLSLRTYGISKSRYVFSVNSVVSKDNIDEFQLEWTKDHISKRKLARCSVKLQ